MAGEVSKETTLALVEACRVWSALAVCCGRASTLIGASALSTWLAVSKKWYVMVPSCIIVTRTSFSVDAALADASLCLQQFEKLIACCQAAM